MGGVPLMVDGGVYSITCVPTGKLYIGSAARSFTTRWKRHLCDLRKGAHHSINLQRTWDKHGEDAFVFTRLLVCRAKDATMYEQLVIDALCPTLNVSPAAGSLLGYKHSPEVRQVMSARRWSDEIRLRISRGRQTIEISEGISDDSRNGRRKLTAGEVVEMRALWASRTETLRGIARRFEIGYTVTRDVCYRKTWRHIQ